MNAANLDQVYTQLCYTLAEVGQEQAPLFLSILSLALISRFEHAEEVLPLIQQAQQQLHATG